MAIQIKSLDDLKIMRKAGLLVRQSLDLIKSQAKAGLTTSALDLIAEVNIRRNGATSNFKGYHGSFPATICVSVNEEIVHGIPGERALMAGDVLSVDCGAIIDGWHGDAAFSMIIGSEDLAVDLADQRMLDVCETSMWRGIAAGKCGAKLSDISSAIEEYINSQGKYGILREYGGHGIGTEMHQEPHILNFGRAGLGPEIVCGMVFAIEPMITRGSAKTRVLDDEWTVVSIDKSRGAHFENSYAICPDGKPFVLTELDGGLAQLGALGIEVSSLLV